MSFFDFKDDSSSSRASPKHQNALDSAREFQLSGASGHRATFGGITERKYDANATENEWHHFEEYSNSNPTYPTPRKAQEYNSYLSSPHPYSHPDHGHDGAAVLDFLSRPTAYADEVYAFSDSDLSSSRFSTPDRSTSLTPPTALSSIYLTNLITTEDVATYLAQTTYTDDVHELPLFLQRLISEARKEVALERSGEGAGGDVAQHRALDRLKMVREHLLMKIGGDVGMIPRDVGSVLSEEELDQVWGMMG
ncbi:hypothetical protein BC936DRAFT_143270 [Jimgerdemannia flammicorona]|uniref:Uncharacterized protein n=1 Tax=Jimgerdemannia flammicorona TaxID=994334 RepID=A0A433DE28_9FUNG|nr:hypothetical protein BC936DRAFT_143270 [Jimgerdemannia flammicorona]